MEGTKHGTFPLHIAIFLGDINTVKWIISHGGDVNVVDKDFETPLSMAAIKGLTDIVKLLLSEKADPNYIYQHGREGKIIKAILFTLTCVTNQFAKFK